MTGLYFPKSKSYKKFNGVQYQLDSFSTNKQDADVRKKMLKESNYLIRIIKQKRKHHIYKRRK